MKWIQKNSILQKNAIYSHFTSLHFKINQIHIPKMHLNSGLEFIKERICKEIKHQWQQKLCFRKMLKKVMPGQLIIQSLVIFRINYMIHFKIHRAMEIILYKLNSKILHQRYKKRKFHLDMLYIGKIGLAAKRQEKSWNK